MFQPFVSGSCFLYGLRSSVAPFPMWSALPPQSTMGRSDSPLPIGWPSFSWYTLPSQRRQWGLPGSWHLSSCVPRSLTPADPRGSHRERSLCVGFRLGNAVAACSCNVTRLNCFGEAQSPLRPTGFSVYASDISFVCPTLHPPTYPQHSIRAAG